MKKISALMCTIAAMCAMAAPVAAGERQGAFSVSPFAGGYTFDGIQHLETAPVFGLRLGYDLTKNWGIEAVADYAPTNNTGANDLSVNAFSYRLDLLYNFTPEGPWVPYVAAGIGGITLGHGSDYEQRIPTNLLGYQGLDRDKNTAFTANAGLGLKYFLTDSVALRGDARQLVVFGEDPILNWEYTGGVTFLFGGKRPGVAPAPAPAPPTSTLSVNPGSVTAGQSATLSWSSQNATGCDIQPGIGPVAPQGSTTITPAANTSYSLVCTGPEGTANSTASIIVTPPVPTATIAATPASVTQGQTAKLVWSSQNATACDIQPNIGAVQPQGTVTVTPSADAVYTLTCTGPGGKANSTTQVGVITAPAPTPKPEQPMCVDLKVEFETAKFVIPTESYDDIAKVGKFLKANPGVKGVIDGHTDIRGSKKYNDKLSLQRAQSVKDYLVSKYGIDSSRLVTRGFGFSKPVGDNKTAEGQQRNRRIIFDCIEK